MKWAFYINAAWILLFAIGLQLLIRSNQPTDVNTIAALAAFGSRDPGTALAGRSVVITGVTSGIGEELAITLLRLGATVYGLARSQTKLAAFAATHGALAGSFKPVLCELSDLDSVARAADSIAREVPEGAGLDYLVNNAGIHYGSPLTMMSVDTTTKHDGLDRCFVVNYLSHVLLTEKLLPLLLKAKSEARVIQVKILLLLPMCWMFTLQRINLRDTGDCCCPFEGFAHTVTEDM